MASIQKVVIEKKVTNGILDVEETNNVIRGNNT